jgi:hypothetical protein
VLADGIAGHEAERRPGAREEGRAAAQHDGPKIQTIHVDQAKFGQASRQIGYSDIDPPERPSRTLP